MKNFKKMFKQILNSKIRPTDFFAAFCASFCASGYLSVNIFKSDTFPEFTAFDLTFLEQPLLAPFFILTLGAFFLGISAAAILLKNRFVIKAGLIITSFAYAFTLSSIFHINANNSFSIAFIIGIAFVFFLVVHYVFDGEFAIIKTDISQIYMFASAFAIAAAVTVFIISAQIALYRSYSMSCFDFGIFAQMFEKMRTTGLPVVTCERNVAMSHFGVHFSPFFYLLLPFYMIYPHPETLIVLQALGFVSGFIPIIFICRHIGLSNKLSLVCSAIYLLFPSLVCPTLTDFHENKFISVLLLWCIYFMLKERKGLFLLFAALTLSVKEDAAIYIIALAAYLFFVKRKRPWGLFVGIVSIIYFLFTNIMINLLGDGVMMSRLYNYLPQNEGGFLTVIRTCFLDLGYAFSQIFTQEKINYIITVMLPLAFTPFLIKKKASLILLLPMIVINLMSDWQYQYDINYQYSYGSSVLAIFLFICVLKELSPVTRQRIALFAILTVTVMFSASFKPRAVRYIGYSFEQEVRERSSAYNEFIDDLPKNAEYTALSVFIPHMYDFETVYMYPNYYRESERTEYLLLTPESVINNYEEIQSFIENRYEIVKSGDGIILYKLKSEEQF